jgi:hypothetical protein
MNAFLRRFAPVVLGILSGFDRLLFRGTLRNLAYAAGLQHYLWANRIAFKDFHAHSQDVTQRLIDASQRSALEQGREIRYLPCSSAGKEDIARAIAQRDGITDGLICILRCVEPCLSFQINKSQHRRRLEIRYRQRQCLHLYHYQMHPVFGFMHVRLQTWFPFRIQVYLNGREWLARQMDRAGLAYQRRDNCFPWLADVARAQALFDEQRRADWPQRLTELARAVNPLHGQIFARYPSDYYWTLHQSEWATDVMFRSRADLEALYPRLVRHGIISYGAGDVLRFLGRRISAAGTVPPAFAGEVVSDVKECREGVRLKHALNGNSVKMYDKGSVLRVETTINHAEQFRAYRTKEGAPEGPKAWLPMRQGVADLDRRAEVSQAANGRYLEAAAAVRDETPLRQLAEPLCQSVPAPSRSAEEPGAPPRPRRRRRALNPLSKADAALLAAVSRPEFAVNGLRNRDVRQLLYGKPAAGVAEQRRRSARVTRQLRLLRGHGLLKKVPKTHRYQVTSHGRIVITALLAARNASAEQLTGSVA